MKEVDRGRRGGSSEGKVIDMGRWSEGNATSQRHPIDGAKWAETRETSGEEGGWFMEVGRRVFVSSFRKTSELSAAADARLPPRVSDSVENQAA